MKRPFQAAHAIRVKSGHRGPAKVTAATITILAVCLTAEGQTAAPDNGLRASGGSAIPWYAPMIGSVLGALLSMGGGYLAQWHATKREREAKERDRDEAQRREWSDFQAKMLVDLLEALRQLSETSAFTHLEVAKHAYDQQNRDAVLDLFKEHQSRQGRVIALLSQADSIGLQSMCAEIVNTSSELLREYSKNMSQNDRDPNLDSNAEELLDKSKALYLHATLVCGEAIKGFRRPPVQRGPQVETSGEPFPKG